MNRDTSLVTWLVRITVFVMVVPLGGCTLVGMGVGAIADAGEPAYGPSAPDVQHSSGGEDIAHGRMLLEPVQQPESSGGVSGTAVGGLVGGVIDVLLVVAVVVAASSADVPPACGSRCTDGSTRYGGAGFGQ